MPIIWAIASAILAGAFAEERHGSILAGSILCGYMFIYDLCTDILNTLKKGKGNGQ